jgi:hypothetical protein
VHENIVQECQALQGTTRELKDKATRYVKERSESLNGENKSRGIRPQKTGWLLPYIKRKFLYFYQG